LKSKSPGVANWAMASAAPVLMPPMMTPLAPALFLANSP
jgi:hypothetical protein